MSLQKRGKHMLKFDEQKQIDSVNGALALRPEIEKIVDEICAKGYDRIVYIGIGGTWASALQAESHAVELSDLPVYSINAAEYNTRGDKRITKDSVIVLSSVSGNTVEIVESMEILNKIGCTSIGFIDNPDAPLAKAVTYCITYPENEQLKFFMVAARFMQIAGELPPDDDD